MLHRFGYSIRHGVIIKDRYNTTISMLIEYYCSGIFVFLLPRDPLKALLNYIRFHIVTNSKNEHCLLPCFLFDSLICARIFMKQYKWIDKELSQRLRLSIQRCTMVYSHIFRIVFPSRLETKVLTYIALQNTLVVELFLYLLVCSFHRPSIITLQWQEIGPHSAHLVQYVSITFTDHSPVF